MSFNAQEISRAKGRPVELFFFRWGDGPTSYYAYTNAEQPVRAVGGDNRPRSVYLALDKSGSMAGTKLATLKTALGILFDRLEQAVIAGANLDFAINFWSDTSDIIHLPQLTLQGIDQLRTFVAGIEALGGTDFNVAAADAHTWFMNSLGSSIEKRVFVFVTDGEPSPLSTATTAATTMADELDQSSGSFRASSNTAVEMYGVNIELANTTYTAMLDNMGEVPVVTSVNASALADIITDAALPFVTYQPIPIDRAAINTSGTLDKSALTIVMAGDAEIAQRFRVYPPSGRVSAVVRQMHLNDPDGESPAMWVGRVVNCSWPGESKAQLTCEPISTSMRRTGLRRHYQYGCPHVLYGAACGASKAAASTVVAVAAVAAANTIEMPAGWNSRPIGKYVGGMVEWRTEEGNVEVRTILRIVSGQHLLVSGLVRDLVAGQALTVYLGCNHQMTDCSGLHVEATTGQPNIKNYGGQPWIPLKNPFGNTNSFY